eukprot:TRINITY_DN13399_c0_g1_i2.p4 TRINITY_DN13399_c0_g1~~TRINITY_DN13399_c0_g1_i2.p4  ORF type:complete len:119 (+),score=2.84 TRINITY_DN13399_c0_g1_i2:336-692(+)
MLWQVYKIIYKIFYLQNFHFFTTTLQPPLFTYYVVIKTIRFFGSPHYAYAATKKMPFAAKYISFWTDTTNDTFFKKQFIFRTDVAKFKQKWFRYFQATIQQLEKLATFWGILRNFPQN